MFGRKRQDGEELKPEAGRGPEDLVAPLAKPPSRPVLPTPPVSRPPVLPPRLGSLDIEGSTSSSVAPPVVAAPAPTPSLLTVGQSSTPRTPVEPFRRVPETPAAPPEKPMRQLIVGRDISLTGEINSCDRLLVEGNVEANLTDCAQVEISEHGLFRGSATVDDVEIHGRFEGSLTVKNRLFIRASGKVTGTVRYGQIEIERGGQISGDVQAQAIENGRAISLSGSDQPLVSPILAQGPLTFN